MIQFLPFPTDSTDFQLVLPAANRFHRLPTGANRAVSRSAAVGGLATSGIGWQSVEPVGNRWNQLTTSEISAKAWETMQFEVNQYEARRLGEFAGSEKHAPHPVFIFSRLQYSKYLAAVRVTKGDQMWQRWAPVPSI
jgi:hypothetical protein